jgi:phosphoenolpyruvate carboxylase
MPRKIPKTIASQHPDHASKPYWHTEAFIPAQFETQETLIAFQELGIDEYKWDWEGKLVDESVTERLLGQNYQYFKENQLGKDKFLTFRLPNPYEETEFRVGRAFMGILSAAALAKQVQLHTPPLFEVILPMTESTKSMIDIHEAFREIAGLKHWIFNMQKSQLEHIQVIPLFEQVDVIVNSDKILAEYLIEHEKRFGYQPDYIRPYVARSDPSMNSGHIATVFAIKIALSKYQELAQKTGVEMYPMIGCAKLLFRGGLAPNNVEKFINEYAGIQTILIQSAFRYDYPKEVAVEGIKKINELIPKYKTRQINHSEEKEIIELIRVFEKYYRQTIKEAAPLINEIAKQFPKRRERVQHVGLFGYSRGVGGVSLPRAIKTTGSLYSIGVPPEIFGTGRAIKEIKKAGKINLLEKIYINLKQDYIEVGGFLNKQNLSKLAAKDSFWKEVETDVLEIESFLGQALEPQTEEQKQHNIKTSQLLNKFLNGENISDLITETGILRKSIG